MNCERCNQPKKEVFLLTSSVYECTNKLCGNEYVEAKDGAKGRCRDIQNLGPVTLYCLNCSGEVPAGYRHWCLEDHPILQNAKPNRSSVKPSVAPLHLQTWRTLDEIYKEVGSFPFTVECNCGCGRGSMQYTEKDTGDVYRGPSALATYGQANSFKLVSVP
jgi:hypothetical protein